MKNSDTQFVIYSKKSLRIVSLTKPAAELPEQYATGLVELREGKITTYPPGLWTSYALPETVNRLTKDLLRK